jgi:hypothetical protein
MIIGGFSVRIFVILVVFVIIGSLLLGSCYSYSIEYGEGAQRQEPGIQRKNHFFLWGLVPGQVSEPNEMAGQDEDFDVTVVHTFVDGLISFITLGIYTPTTTKITK